MVGPEIYKLYTNLFTYVFVLSLIISEIIIAISFRIAVLLFRIAINIPFKCKNDFFL